MTDDAKWAVVVPPTDGKGGGAWGPFETKKAAEDWRNQQIDTGDSDSETLYKRAYVLRLDNPV